MDGPEISEDDQRSAAEPALSWTVSQLRDFLKKKGGRLSGKKSELFER